MKRLRAYLAALSCATSSAFGAGLAPATQSHAASPELVHSPAGQPQTPDSVVAKPERTDARTYIQWLEEHSMLRQAQVLAQRYSGNAVQWQHPFGQPQPRAAEGSGIICVAIVGGAVVPLITGHTADLLGLKAALLVPAVCYAGIAGFGLYARRPWSEGAAARA